MAPPGSPRILAASSILIAVPNMKVKEAMKNVGFSKEEIASDNKQRVVRKRRDRQKWAKCELIRRGQQE